MEDRNHEPNVKMDMCLPGSQEWELRRKKNAIQMYQNK